MSEQFRRQWDLFEAPATTPRVEPSLRAPLIELLKILLTEATLKKAVAAPGKEHSDEQDLG